MTDQTVDPDNLVNRNAVARLVIDVSIDHASAYRRNITQLSTDEEREVAEMCAAAASNTGWMILDIMGFSRQFINKLSDEKRARDYEREQRHLLRPQVLSGPAVERDRAVKDGGDVEQKVDGK